jgi:3-oxoacyl-[acyl-carrier-protein] synthase-3
LNKKATIKAIEYYLPERVETNEELGEQNQDWKMESIYSKTGISARHIASENETAVDLAFFAANTLIQSSKINKTDIDFLLLCTESPDYFIPPGSCILQDRLGLPNSVAAFDFNLGCSGFVYGLAIARGLIESGIANNILLCNSDTYSKFINKRDRTVRTLFGDGATATLISATDEETGLIQDFDFGTDGKKSHNLIVPAGAFRLPISPETTKEYTDESGCTHSQNNIYMDGASIFSFVISTIPGSIKSLLGRSNLTIQDINWFVFHQASKFMIDHLVRKLGIDRQKNLMFLEEVGNTVSASIPIVLKEADKAGKLKKGDKILLSGFGVGLSWASGILDWGKLL